MTKALLSLRGGRKWYNKLGHIENDKKERVRVPKGKRKDYSPEFKLAVVMMMKSGKMRPKEVFAIFDIDRQTAYRWVHEFDEFGEAAFRPEKAVLPAATVKELQKENERLREENEILKKAAAYFAEKRKNG